MQPDNTLSLPVVLDRMLPDQVESARDMIPVLDSLKVKGLPGRRVLLNELCSNADILRLCRVLGTISDRSGQSAYLLDKNVPHAQFEAMLLSAGKTVKSGVADHTQAFGQKMFSTVPRFAQLAIKWGLHPVVSWSYDPQTCDRASIQGEKRYHMHLMGRTQSEVQLAGDASQPLHELPCARRRRVCDEFSTLGALMLQDAFSQRGNFHMQPVPVFNTPVSTACFQFRLEGGWEAFGSAIFVAELRMLERLILDHYKRVAAGCFNGSSGPWKRPVPKCPSETGAAISQMGFSSYTAGLLEHYMAHERQRFLSDIQTPPEHEKKEILTNTYPLAGPAFSVSFSESRGSVYGHVRVARYSDLGGAGVSVIAGTVVKIKKGVGIFSDHEIAARREFQAAASQIL